MKTEFDAFEIAMLIKEIYSDVMRKVGSGLLESGLTHQQIMIIKLIAHNQNKEINMTDICREMALTKGTVSGIVKRLELAGYVEKIKHIDDKRNTYVVFSERGRTFSREFRETINNSFQSVFMSFTAEELDETKKNLKILRNRIKEQTANE
jgi:MarR family transcriptional regulator, organic hydroperoxide resistance regulator